MKIICAGYPKTGSKSCSAALRILGYKVADWLETAEYLGGTWIVGITGRVPILWGPSRSDWLTVRKFGIPESLTIWTRKLKSRRFLTNMMNLGLMLTKIRPGIFYGKNFTKQVQKTRKLFWLCEILMKNGGKVGVNFWFRKYDLQPVSYRFLSSLGFL